MKTIFNTLALAGLFMLGGNPAAQSEPPVDAQILQWLRIVEDPDGQTNVRSGPSVKAKIVGQVKSGGVISIVPNSGKDGWERIDAYPDDEQFIHSSRLRKVDAWKQFAVTKAEETSAVLKAAGAEVRVKSVPFVAADHRITRDKDGFFLVDGGQVWGRDGETPTHEMALTVALGGKDVPLPKDAVKNLYEPSMESLYLLTPGDPAKQALVLMMNSDGAGAYCVAWVFQNGAYVGRVVFVPF